MIVIKKEFSLAYAHILPNHAGKCRRLHGHNAKIVVAVVGLVDATDSSPAEGMVMDFTVLKDMVNDLIIKPWDHRFLAKGDEWPCEGNLVPASEHYDDIFDLGIRTTAENLAAKVFELLTAELERMGQSDVMRILSVEWWETPTSMAVAVADQLPLNVQGINPFEGLVEEVIEDMEGSQS